MVIVERGRLRARLATTALDLRRAQGLRARAFGLTAKGVARDCDRFDRRCRHVLIEAMPAAALVGCFRVLPLSGGAEIGQSYSAQFYDLAALARFGAPMAEVGRFCLDPDHHDPDVLRLAWAALTRMVLAGGIGMLFGCTSFAGTDAGAYLDTFAMLRAGHLAPGRWRPGIKGPGSEAREDGTPGVFAFARRLGTMPADPRRAAAKMPPLLRTYLMMGGWVSDHAVIDHDLGTLHVFTGVEIAAIPPARVRSLRAAAGV
jgi:putative hemolysin